MARLFDRTVSDGLARIPIHHAKFLLLASDYIRWTPLPRLEEICVDAAIRPLRRSVESHPALPMRGAELDD
jgi:hypothetical protein